MQYSLCEEGKAVSRRHPAQAEELAAAFGQVTQMRLRRPERGALGGAQADLVDVASNTLDRCGEHREVLAAGRILDALAEGLEDQVRHAANLLENRERTKATGIAS